jgi:non-heme Fe2+,alpha-ketoglutarate-dependent halogenase
MLPQKIQTFDLAAQLPKYEEEGFLYPIPLLSPEEARYYRNKIEELEAVLGSEVRRFDFSHLFFDWSYKLATHPRLLDYMETLIGPEIYVQSVRIFSKPVGDPAYVTWHQDGRHSSLYSKVAPTVWIALSPSTRESGCLRVESGSHKLGLIPHIENFIEDNLLNDGDEAQKPIQENMVRHIELQPGEMSIHHVRTLHSSLPNQSKDRRLGFSMTFINPELEGSSMQGVYARGKGNYANHELFDGPPSYALDTSIKKHTAFTREKGIRPIRR